MAVIPETSEMAHTSTNGRILMTVLLVITSNIEPGIEYCDGMGPFIIGKNLTITCSTAKSNALSWWELDKQLETFVNVEDGIISSNYIVGTLQAEDSHRRFTCLELVSKTEKSVDLHLINDHMQIQNGGRPLENEQKVEVFAGTNFSLDCIVYGSTPSTGSWWEGETKLPAKRTKSPTVIHNQLTLGPASIEDNGRRLTCRARNRQLSKTVVLNVVEDGQITVQSPATQAPSTTRTHATVSSAYTEQPTGTSSKGNSGATTSTEETQDWNDIKESLVTLGAAVFSVCVVLVILAALLLTTLRTIHRRNIAMLQ